MPRNATSKSTSRKTSANASRSATKTSSHDVLALLSADHKKVKKLFSQFLKLHKNKDADIEEKQDLVEAACAELMIHAQVEEEIFYPAVHDATEDTSMLDEAEVEHAVAKQLITELTAMQPGDELYEAKFIVLGEYVSHHIEEEEKFIFARAKKAKLDLEELAEEIRNRKQELREELGMQTHEENGDMFSAHEGQGKHIH